jgi:hypothetical protein
MSALMAQAPGGPPPGPDTENPADTSAEGGQEEPTGGGDGDETSIYQQMIDLGQQALSLPTVDAIEAADLQKCISALQNLLAKNQKAVDSALGTSPQLRKALASGGGA